jgi:hypothetical protein
MGIRNSASVSTTTALNRSSPWAPISATAITALIIPCVRRVTPCGISRKARSNFNACSLSALCEGGRDNDLQLPTKCRKRLPYDMPVDTNTFEMLQTLKVRNRISRNSISSGNFLLSLSPQKGINPKSIWFQRVKYIPSNERIPR